MRKMIIAEIDRIHKELVGLEKHEDYLNDEMYKCRESKEGTVHLELDKAVIRGKMSSLRTCSANLRSMI